MFWSAFHSGELTATDKIALIYVEGTISPPFTGHILKAVEQAGRDDHVKGVVLVVDSPGGLVADSHEIYHELRKLNQDHHKPIYVSMRRLAASGGYYVSMGAGPDGLLFAEPTTWSGSIGVIIPHYDVSGLADKLGVKEDSPKTGKFKDTLTIFRPVSEAEKELWKPILDDSLDRFIKVIAESRKSLDVKQIRELATGQIFTSNQAKDKKLIDKIGYLEDAIDALKAKLQLKHVRVVRYESSQTLLETILSSRSAVSPPQSQLGALLESTVPRLTISSRRHPVWPPAPVEVRSDFDSPHIGGQSLDGLRSAIALARFASRLQLGGRFAQTGESVSAARPLQLVRPRPKLLA